MGNFTKYIAARLKHLFTQSVQQPHFAWSITKKTYITETYRHINIHFIFMEWFQWMWNLATIQSSVKQGKGFDCNSQLFQPVTHFQTFSFSSLKKSERTLNNNT